MGKTIEAQSILTVIVTFMLYGCVTVEDFDFENYETAKAKSILFKEPIVNKEKKRVVVTPKRLVAKVQKAKLERAIQLVSPENKLDRLEIKLYTPELIIDPRVYPAGQAKGAALLVWTRKSEAMSYEVEIFQGVRSDLKNLFSAESHFLYIMVYFNKDYFWRVRLMDEQGQPLSEYSSLKALKVIPRDQVQRITSSDASEAN